MCQLFRGEDYPTVYGTNMIPKFPQWCLVAYCPTVKTSEFAQIISTLISKSGTKKHLQRLAIEQVIKCDLTDRRVISRFEGSRTIVCPLVLINGTFHLHLPAEEPKLNHSARFKNSTTVFNSSIWQLTENKQATILMTR